MMFFLSKTWPLLLVAALVGALVSWLLCRRRGVAGVVPVAAGCDHDVEIDRLKARIVELEQAPAVIAAPVAEEPLPAASVAAPLVASVAAPVVETVDVPVVEEPVVEKPVVDVPVVVVPVVEEPVVEKPVVDVPVVDVPVVEEPVVEKPVVDVPVVEEPVVEEPVAPQPVVTVPVAAAPVDVPDTAPALDLTAAAAALGRRIRLDDLTVVEGIGPQISGLCNGIGILTWRQLADCPVEKLQEMLTAAGPRFQVHRPASWPRQAALLADGRWAEFAALTDSLKGGREV